MLKARLLRKDLGNERKKRKKIFFSCAYPLLNSHINILYPILRIVMDRERAELTKRQMELHAEEFKPNQSTVVWEDNRQAKEQVRTLKQRSSPSVISM
jgi:hypothetical protein